MEWLTLLDEIVREHLSLRISYDKFAVLIMAMLALSITNGQVIIGGRTIFPPFLICWSLLSLFYIYYYFLCLSHFKPLPFRWTSPWSQGINPSVPGTRLAFWSRRVGQHFRTASTLDKHSVDHVVYSHSYAFHGENEITKEKPNASGIDPSAFPS